MYLLKNSRKLADHVLRLSDFYIDYHQYCGYNHMGAIITDAILQAGLNYKNVVEPRVKNVLINYPHANTSSRFYSVLDSEGAGKVINWTHEEKIQRIRNISCFLISHNIETEENLVSWITTESNSNMLLDIPGVGPKTVDYMKKLLGLPAVPVDRHVRSFVYDAGINLTEYEEIRSVVEYAADLLDVPRQVFDRSIWKYCSNNA